MRTKIISRIRGAIAPLASWPAASLAARVALVAAVPLAPLANGQSLAAQGTLQDQEVTVLTLRDALMRAAEHNPEYRQALNRLELEGPRRRQALGAFLPNFSVSYSTGQSVARELSWVGFDGTPITNPEPRTVTRSSSSQRASLGIDLFQGGKRFHELGRARAQARVDRHGSERDLNRILAEVQRQFLVAQRHRLRLAVEEDLLAARERDYEMTERRFELVATGRSDVLGAELELETQRVTVTDIRGQVEKAMLALRREIGDPSLAALDVQQPLPEPFDPATLDLGALVARALRESPTVAAAEATLAVSQSNLSAEKADRWPSLSLSSSISRGSYGQERSSLFKFNPEGFNGGLSLSVSIPLFTRFQTSQSIATANIELRNARETIRKTELDVDELIRSRYVDLETAWANVRQRSRALEVASERLEIVREEYRLATKSIEDLRTAIRDEAAARRDAVDQRFEFAVFLVGLYEAAGIVGREAGLDPAIEGN